MKYLVTLIFISSIFYSAHSQIYVGLYSSSEKYPTEISDELVEQLSRTTTYFVYRPGDLDILDEMKEEFEDIWDLSELEFISYDEYLEIDENNKSTSFLSINHVNGVSTGSDNSTVRYAKAYICLWSKTSGEFKTYAKIYLYPHAMSYEKMTTQYCHAIKKNTIPLHYMYYDAKFENWNTAYIKHSLRIVNRHLKEGTTRTTTNRESTPEVANLKENTLFIPESVLEYQKNKDLSVDVKQDADKVFAAYKYPYKIIPDEELNEMILNSEETFYYLSYVWTNRYKYVNIINSSTGEVISNKAGGDNSDRFDKYDISPIIKAIKKS